MTFPARPGPAIRLQVDKYMSRVPGAFRPFDVADAGDAGAGAGQRPAAGPTRTPEEILAALVRDVSATPVRWPH
jgi:hypothetical protein